VGIHCLHLIKSQPPVMPPSPIVSTVASVAHVRMMVIGPPWLQS
jgi:hypothetical protein